MSAVGLEAFQELFQALPTCVFIADAEGRPLYANHSALEHFGPLDAMTSLPDLFPQPYHALVHHRLTDSVGDRAIVQRPVDGIARIYSGYTLALQDQGQRRVALILHEITDHMRARREAEALAQVAAATAFAGSLEETMNALAEAVVRSTNSDACSVVLYDEATGGLRFIGSYGLPPNYGREFNRIWADHMPALDMSEHSEHNRQITRGARRALLENPEWAVLHPLLRNATWDTMASTPLRYRGRLLGALTCYYAPDRQTEEDENAFLQAVADQAAVAVENARLIIQVRQKAVLEERQRLARELHDSVSQALYGIGLGAKTALVHLERAPADAREPMEYVMSLAEGGLAEMRALIFELRPDDLEREGLVAALRRHTAALRMRHGIGVTEEMADEPELTPEQRLALYRIGQEALHNVARHAQARAVHVHLRVADDVRLEIADDGIGFDADGEFPGHLGLKSMRERVERLGGRFHLQSEIGQGTRIAASVPRPPSSAPQA